MSKLSSRLKGAAAGALIGFTAGSLGGATYYEPKFHKRRKAGDKLSYRKDVINKSFNVAKKGALAGALLGGLKGINEMNIDQMIESVRNGVDPEVAFNEYLSEVTIDPRLVKGYGTGLGALVGAVSASAAGGRGSLGQKKAAAEFDKHWKGSKTGNDYAKAKRRALTAHELKQVGKGALIGGNVGYIGSNLFLK